MKIYIEKKSNPSISAPFLLYLGWKWGRLNEYPIYTLAHLALHHAKSVLQKEKLQSFSDIILKEWSVTDCWENLRYRFLPVGGKHVVLWGRVTRVEADTSHKMNEISVRGWQRWRRWMRGWKWRERVETSQALPSLRGAVCNNSNAVRSENEGGKYHLRFAMLEVW